MQRANAMHTRESMTDLFSRSAREGRVLLPTKGCGCSLPRPAVARESDGALHVGEMPSVSPVTTPSSLHMLPVREAVDRLVGPPRLYFFVPVCYSFILLWHLLASGFLYAGDACWHVAAFA
jgi:hypothetical protein